MHNNAYSTYICTYIHTITPITHVINTYKHIFYMKIPDTFTHKGEFPVISKIAGNINDNKGYYHSELDDTRSLLTVFYTPFTRFRFTRMPFGFTLAGDTFKYKLDTNFNHLAFCTGTADGMLM